MQIRKCDTCFIEKVNDYVDVGWDELIVNQKVLDLCPACNDRIRQVTMDEIEAMQKEARGRLEDDKNKV